MSSTVSFYTSDLELMMAFVCERSKFLDTVTDAVTAEDKNSDAAKMVALLENQAFLLTMPALLNDRDLSVRSKAYLALGNLIASDNLKIARLAFNIGIRSFKYIEKGFDAKETFAGAAYALHNLALRIRDWAKEDEYVTLRTLMREQALIAIGAEGPSVAKRDLLYTITYIGSHTDVPTRKLIDLCSSKHCGRLAFKLLSEQLADEEFAADCVEQTYLLLCDRVENYHNQKNIHELMWAFSNIVCENGIADRFLSAGDTLGNIMEIALTWNHFLGAAEAAWTLTNAIARGDVKQLDDHLLYMINDCISTFVEDWAPKNPLKKSLGEAQAKISEEFERREDEAAAARAQKVAEDAMDIDDEAEWPETTPADDGWTDYCLPCELPTPSEPATESVRTSYFPPSAFDLLLTGRTYGEASKTVADLIESVRVNNFQFTALPADVALTAADLQALECRGFVIQRGHVGINQLITAAVYSL